MKSSKIKLVEVAAAVLQRPDGSFLLAQRPTGKIWAGYWEFPGGKIEAGEAPYHALIRELREELGIEVETAYPWITRVFTYPHATVRLNFFRVMAWRGELHPHEGQKFAWQRFPDVYATQETSVSLFPQKHEPSLIKSLDSRLMKLLAIRLSWQRTPAKSLVMRGNDGITVSPVLPANAPILRALELPFLYAISNAAELGAEEFLRRLERALQNGLRLLQVREKDLSGDALAQFAVQAVQMAHRYGAKVLVNGDTELAKRVGADGVQLTAAQLAGLHERPDVDWCAASCHNAEALRRAEALGCDFALLSPVLPTLSHPGAPHLGWENFAVIAASSSIPVYALGGLCRDDMITAWQHGAHGIALLRQAW